jgi:hypothetical protein
VISREKAERCPDIDTALTNLMLGRAPGRVGDDGTW